MATVIDNSSLLLFRVGPVLCCAPSLPIESIIPPPTLTHPPGTDRSNPGIFRHSGHIVSSWDLRYKFGVEQEHWTNPGRMIITEIDPGRIGFWVDEIIDVIEVPTRGWSALPSHLPKGIFSRTLILDNKIFLYAEFSQLYKIPVSGYLRVYIEQLLHSQQQEMKQAIGDLGPKSASTQLNPTKVDDPSRQQKNVTEIPSSSTTASSASTPGTVARSEPSVAKTIAENNSILNTTTSTIHTLHANKSVTPSSTIPTQHDDKETPIINNETRRVDTGEINPDRDASTDPVVASTETGKRRSLSSTGLDKSGLEKVVNHKAGTTNKITAPFNSQTNRGIGTLASIAMKHNRPTVNPDHHDSPTNKPSTEGRSLAQASSTKKVGDAATDYQHAKTQQASFQPTNTEPGHKPVNHKVTQSKLTKEDDEPSSSLLPGILILFLFVGSIAGSSWYLMQEPETLTVASTLDYKPITTAAKTKNHPTVTASREPAIADELPPEDIVTKRVTEAETETEVTLSDSPADGDAQTDMLSTPTISTLAMQPVDESTVDIDVEKTTIPVSTQTSTNDADDQPEAGIDYKADIQQDDEGITIILDAPDETDVLKPLVGDNPTEKGEPDTALSPNADETIDVTISHEPVSSNDSAHLDNRVDEKPVVTKSTPQTVSSEIIHIVVKGDTLWHIAIKYVNNPYKYPELARLSNIKNPDLIYPGNRVRIIKRRKQSQ